MGKFDGITVEELQPAASGQIDFNLYDGVKSEIAGIKIATIRSDYNDDGQLVPGLQREMPEMRVFTKVVGQKETGDDIVAMEKLPMKIDAKTGKPIYSLHEKSKTKRLLNHYKVNTPAELVGKPVTVIIRCGAKNPDFKWLGFNY